jgi:hypothetical protein
MENSIPQRAVQKPGGIARGADWARREPGLWVTLALYLASRVAYVAAGLKFDVQWASDYGMHLLAPDLLRNDLWRSIFYLHGQPPLFNLYYAAILRLFPGNEALGFQISYWILGLILTVSLYALLRRLGAPAAISAAVTTVFVLSAAALFYETRGFYEQIVVTLLIGAALLLEEYFRTRKTAVLAGLFSLLAAIVLIRTTFHLVWMVACLALVLFFDWKNWRKVLLVFCIPFLLATAWYAKNYFVFGQFTGSTWFGMNMSRIATYSLPHDLRDPLIQQGKLSSLASMTSIFDYRLDQHQTLKTGIPALDEVYKTPGNYNYNNINVIAFSQQCLKDALTVIRIYPKNYIFNTFYATMLYFQQSSYFSTYQDTPQLLLDWEQIDQAIYIKPWMHVDGTLINNTNVVIRSLGRALASVNTLMVAYILAFWFGLKYVVRSVFKRDPANPRQPVIVFLVFMLVYITVVSNVAEMQMNFRFRFMADPYLWLLVGLALTSAWGGLKKLAR